MDSARTIPIELPVRGSWPLALVVLMLAVAALIAVWLSRLHPAWQLGLSVVVAGYSVHGIRRALKPRWVRIAIDGERVRAEDRSGRRLSGMLVGQSFVSPVFVGLRWREDNARLPQSVGIFRKQVPGDDFRRLCAALRFPGPA